MRTSTNIADEARGMLDVIIPGWRDDRERVRLAETMPTGRTFNYREYWSMVYTFTEALKAMVKDPDAVRRALTIKALRGE